MKLVRGTRIRPAAAGLLLLPLLACAGGETEEEMAADTAAMEAEMANESTMQGFPEGDYPLPEGRRVVVAGGEYTVYQGDSVVVQGHYESSGDTVVFTDHAGSMACPDTARGVYTWTLEDGEPSLTLVSDPCEGRRNDITGGSAEAGEGASEG